MTLAVFLVDLAGLLLLAWLLNLIRVGRLYVGYGALFVLLVLFVMGIVSVRPAVTALDAAAGSLFPNGRLLTVAVGGIFLLVVYVLSQVTIVANRLATLVQELAIERSQVPSRDEPPQPPA